MKKSNMWIASLVMMMAVSAARAGNIEVNFDSESKQGASFAELIRTMPVSEAVSPTSVGPFDVKESELVFYKLAKTGRQTLRSVVSKSKDDLFDRNVVSLINDEKTDILYNSKAVVFVNSLDGNGYKTRLQSADGRLIGLLQKLSAHDATQQTKSAQIVCKFVEMVLWELVKGVWTEVIKQVKECHSEEVDDNPGMGGPMSWPVRSAAAH